MAISKGVLCIIGCSLAISVGFTQLGGLGLVWGTMVLYVASYYHHFDTRATVQSMYYVFPVSGILFSCGSSKCYLVLGTYAYQRYGARLVLSFYTLLLSGVLLSCSFLSDYVSFMVVYCLFQGLACSGIVFPAMFPPWAHYPRHRGLVTGVIMVAYGGGCALQGLAFTYLVNPANASPTLSVHSSNGDPEQLFTFDIAQNCPFAFRVFAAAFAFIGCSGALLITEPAHDRSLLSEASLAKPDQLLESADCPSLQVALCTWSFWCLFLVNFTSYTYTYFLMVQFKTYAQPYIHNDHLLSTIGAIGQVGNVFGRLVMTVLVDYMDNRLLLVLNSLGSMLLACTINWTVTTVWWYTLWVALSFFFFGFSLSPTAVICGKIYGPK